MWFLGKRFNTRRRWRSVHSDEQNIIKVETNDGQLKGCDKIIHLREHTI